MVKGTGTFFGNSQGRNMITVFTYIQNCHIRDKLCFFLCLQVEHKAAMRYTRRKYSDQYEK